MKKNRSIFQQLVLNILLPVFIILLIFSSVSYYINKQKLQDSYKKERDQITSEVKSILKMYDQALILLEEEIDKEIHRVAYTLKRNYFQYSDSVATADLYRISEEIKMDTVNFDIYMINRDLVIDNTTYPKDHLLDFKKINDDLVNFLNTVFDKDSLLIDRFGGEMSTKKIKKYAYLTTDDKKYIMEFGAYSPKADLLEDKVYEEIKGLKNNFPELNEIKFYVATENTEYENIPDGQKKYQLEALRGQKSVRAEEEVDGVKWYYDYIYIKMPGATLYSGYMLLIISNDTREKKLLSNELIRFSWMTLATLFPLSLLVYFRSRKIIRPIKKLNEKANIISKGNLSERVPVEGSKEIVELSGTFNKMVSELEDLYQGLEQKVKDRTMELQHQKEIVEEKQKEIIDSINYAKRLQDAILPPQKMIDENADDNFVLYKPKDIVAGDFYWAEKSGDWFFIAAADCTGHGVPGAMVSVVCSNALNRTVKEFGITDTGKILDKTTDLVLETFEKSNEDVKDGMDISLLGINSKTKEIFWSGANNPLWFTDGNEIKEIKANKQPIGKSDHRIAFISHKIEINKGEMIYLFTDGYADQFGGEKGKKYKYKPFSELLLYNKSLELSKQKEILNDKIEEWKGDLEQNDDICIIGIRIV